MLIFVICIVWTLDSLFINFPYCKSKLIVWAIHNVCAMLYTFAIYPYLSADCSRSFKCPHVIEVFQQLVRASRVAISRSDAI